MKNLAKKKNSDNLLFINPAIVDNEGRTTKNTSENSCSCYSDNSAEKFEVNINATYKSGCLYCGEEIIYPEQQVEEICYFCKTKKTANAKCKNNHFICDSCHSGDIAKVVENLCLSSDETDMISLFTKIRKHNQVPVNGPEHHFIIPGAITAVYRNLGGNISDNDIINAIKRGKDIPGGTCGFWGVCGASLGSGIAFSTILSSSPLTPGARKIVQQAVSEITSSVSGFESARCCRRESLSVLIKVAEISKKILPVALNAGIPEKCDQFRQNRECPGNTCRYFPKSALVKSL